MTPARGSLSITLMRGGTSKGVFIHTGALPPAGTARDQLILDLMGSPDPMQLDGLGGSHSSTSKLMAVEKSQREGIDVEYLFAQVGVDTAVVDYKGNCGNLTAAVGAYAVDERLVDPVVPITAVRLMNVNTGVRVLAHVPVEDGRAATTGNQTIPGVPTPGAPIVNEYLSPGGSVTGSVLPTGKRREYVDLPDGSLQVSLVDVVHPLAFVRACDLGISGKEAPSELNAQPALLARIESIRAACAVRIGAITRSDDAATHSPTIPRLVILAPSAQDAGTTLAAYGLSLGRVHHALPITSTLCTAVATQLDGTLAYDLALGGERHAQSVWITHPKGTVEATVKLDDSDPPTVHSVGVVRTARRLLDGTAYPRPASKSAAADAEEAA